MTVSQPNAVMQTQGFPHSYPDNVERPSSFYFVAETHSAPIAARKARIAFDTCLSFRITTPYVVPEW